jgi:hypothetical protein
LTRGASKRRYRIRRKRRDDSLAGDVGEEVVAEFGCCLVRQSGVSRSSICSSFPDAFC